jgi:flagellar biosynthetic protein FliR
MHDLVNMFGPGWVTAVLLLAVRVAVLLMLTPILYAVSMPAMIRALVILGIACVVALPFSGTGVPAVHDVGGLLQAVLREAAIGATLGLGVLVAFAGFMLAGQLIDLQAGFGMAQVFDPATRTRVPIVSATFGLLAAVFFFVVDGHHALLRGLAFSVERFPIGRGWDGATAAEPLVRQLAGLFTLGFALAAPVVLGLLLVEFALGVLSRNLPQMNMLVLGLPVKILVALFALSVWAAGFAAPAGRLYAGIYQAWGAWFAAGATR